MLSCRQLRAAVLIAAVALAGCARQTPPAPVELVRQGGRSTSAGESAAAFPADGYVVQRGDTLYGVARRFSVTTRDLIDANGLQAPYALAAGQRLTLTPGQQARAAGRHYTVAAGDTLSAASRRFCVALSTLVRLHDVPPPHGTPVGPVLALPDGVAGEA